MRIVHLPLPIVGLKAISAGVWDVQAWGCFEDDLNFLLAMSPISSHTHKNCQDSVEDTQEFLCARLVSGVGLVSFM